MAHVENYIQSNDHSDNKVKAGWGVRSLIHLHDKDLRNSLPVEAIRVYFPSKKKWNKPKKKKKMAQETGNSAG